MQFKLETLEYKKNLFANYQTLIHLPGFVLLQSGDKNKGRYDILSAYPYDECFIDRKARCIETVFEKLQTNFSFRHSEIDLPFQGGAIGYVSYDFGALSSGITSEPHPLVANMPLLDMKYYDWAIIVDHYLEKISIINANQSKGTASLIEEVIKLWKNPTSEVSNFYLKDNFKPILSKEDYRESISTIHKHLKAGRTYQVNFTQPFLAEYEGDAWEFYKKIQKINPVPFSAYLNFLPHEILSFSPERFLQAHQGKVIASPIKGSCARSSNPERDGELANNLKKSEKNWAENVMIVDLLRNDLGKFALPGTVSVKNLCALESYEAVHHLVSTIEAEFDQSLTPWEIFMHCFPGGSITGAPKREAMKAISELERYSRGIYCGSIGYISNHGQFDFNIAIRTITALQNTFYLPVGGGIVMDSNWEEEYQECYTKIAAFLNN